EPARERQGSREQRLPQQDEYLPEDHRIADVAADALDHEPLRGLPGSEGALADRHEQPDCGDHQEKFSGKCKSHRSLGERISTPEPIARDRMSLCPTATASFQVSPA